MSDNGTRNGQSPVRLIAGEQASGLANIVGQYLEQLIGESPQKRSEADALRGNLGLLAREGDVAITIVFSDDGICIEEGLSEADAVISGKVEQLMHVLAGRANPVWAVAGGRMAFRPGLRRPLFGYQAYKLMRLPGVHPWSGLPRPVLVGAGSAAVLGAVLLAYGAGRRARGGAHG